MIYLERLLKCKLALLKLKSEDYCHDSRSLLFTLQVSTFPLNSEASIV